MNTNFDFGVLFETLRQSFLQQIPCADFVAFKNDFMKQFLRRFFIFYIEQCEFEKLFKKLKEILIENYFFVIQKMFSYFKKDYVLTLLYLYQTLSAFENKKLINL